MIGLFKKILKNSAQSRLPTYRKCENRYGLLNQILDITSVNLLLEAILKQSHNAPYFRFEVQKSDLRAFPEKKWRCLYYVEQINLFGELLQKTAYKFKVRYWRQEGLKLDRQICEI